MSEDEEVIYETNDGFGEFTGYDDEAGHHYPSKQAVIDDFGYLPKIIKKRMRA